MRVPVDLRPRAAGVQLERDVLMLAAVLHQSVGALDRSDGVEGLRLGVFGREL